MAESPRIQRRGKRLDTIQREPWPEGETFTVRAIALRFHKRPQTIYNVLAMHASEFSRPKYAQVYRGRGDRRLYRILTEVDMTLFRSIFTVRVK